MAVGKGKRLEDGKLVALDVQVGDRILFGKYSGSDIKLDGDEYMIMREDEILGILEEEPLRQRRRANNGKTNHLCRQLPTGDPARRESAGQCRESHPRT